MRHRYRATRRDLALEDGNDAAIRSQDVSESHGGKNRIGALRIVLDDHFTHAFCRTHDRCGVYGFIGRDENETRDFVLVCKADRIERAEYVVLNSLARAHLHERNMLMGRSMEDRMGMIPLEHVAQTRLIAYASDFDNAIQIIVVTQYLAAQQIRIVFVHVVDDDALGRHRAHLAA